MFSDLPVIILDVTKTNFMLKMHFKGNPSFKSRIFTVSKKSSLAIRSCGLHYCGVLPKVVFNSKHQSSSNAPEKKNATDRWTDRPSD
jgi:hypothetical protein